MGAKLLLVLILLRIVHAREEHARRLRGVAVLEDKVMLKDGYPRKRNHNNY